MEYQQRLQKAMDDMREAERQLIASGFSPDQWLLVKQYIQSSILHFQLAYARALQEATDRMGQGD